jgi:hypothetical protein
LYKLYSSLLADGTPKASQAAYKLSDFDLSRLSVVSNMLEVYFDVFDD